MFSSDLCTVSAHLTSFGPWVLQRELAWEISFMLQLILSGKFILEAGGLLLFPAGRQQCSEFSIENS